MKTPRPASLVTFALWTTATAALILAAAAAPSPLHATDAPRPPRRVAAPSLTANDCTLTLALGNAEPTDAPGLYRLNPGRRPVLTVAARNPLRAKRTVSYTVRLYSSAGAGVSRVPSAPRSVWSHSDEIVLGPEEQRAVPVIVDGQPRPGSTFSVELSDNQYHAIRPITFVVAPGAPTTAPVQ